MTVADPKPLSERGKLRLRIAAGLLRGMGRKLSFPREQFYDEIQAVLSALPAPEQAELKGLVDWVESYDRAETQSASVGKARAEFFKESAAAKK